MMKSFNPLVSVIITTFNVEKYIEYTILSVLNQTFGNFEIIVVDDSSEDKTLEIIDKLSHTDKRIKFYRIEHAGRPSIPRNFGISKAAGELIAFLDGDDLWEKGKLKEQVTYLENHKDLIFVYSMSVTYGVNILSNQYEVLPLLHKAARSYGSLISKGNSITCSSVLVNKHFMEKVNGFDEDPQLAIEDYDLWIRLSKLGNFGFIPRVHVYYRVHPVQFSGNWEIKQKRLEYLAAKRGLTLPDYKFIRNRGFLFIVFRSLIHYATYLWVKVLKTFNVEY